MLHPRKNFLCHPETNMLAFITGASTSSPEEAQVDYRQTVSALTEELRQQVESIEQSVRSSDRFQHVVGRLLERANQYMQHYCNPAPYPCYTLIDTVAGECAICLEELSHNAVELNCGQHHYTHKQCIDQWIIRGSNTCPMCRKRMRYVVSLCDMFDTLASDCRKMAAEQVCSWAQNSNTIQGLLIYVLMATSIPNLSEDAEQIVRALVCILFLLFGKIN